MNTYFFKFLCSAEFMKEVVVFKSCNVTLRMCCSYEMFNFKMCTTFAINASTRRFGYMTII